MSPLDRLKWLAAIAKDPRVHEAEIRLAVVLADHQNALTDRCNPSVSTLARLTGKTRRTIRRATQALAQIGYLRVDQSDGGTSLATNHYSFLTPDVGVTPTPDVGVTPDARVTPDVHVRQPLTHTSVTPDAHVTQTREEQGIEQGTEKRTAQSKKNGAKANPKTNAKSWQLPEGIDPQVWAEFEQHRKEKREPLSDLGRTKNANVLRRLSPQQQQASVDKTIANNWKGLFPPKERSGNAGATASVPRLQDGEYV